MKREICTVVGLLGGVISSLLGGWDTGLITLVIFMVIDFFSGLVVAGVFKNSTKTASGALESGNCWKGICKKIMTLVVVCVAYRLDLVIGVNYIRDAVIIGFIANEAISIMENAGLMGLPLPAVITKAIDVLINKDNTSKENSEETKGDSEDE